MSITLKNSKAKGVRIPPAWTDVKFDRNPRSPVVATGYDAAGRKQYVYTIAHMQRASAGKFQRVRALLEEWEDVRTQIEGDVNDPSVAKKDREAVLVTYLIYETGMRPGSNSDTLAATKAYGATTLQLRHVKSCAQGVRLQFVGKKGVKQNVLVTNPYLVELLLARKKAGSPYANLFNVSSTKVNQYVSGLGSGGFTAKDLRTARGTSMADALLGNRKRLPTTKAGRKRVMNKALDQIAKFLGNTRAVCKSAYVEPSVLARFVS